MLIFLKGKSKTHTTAIVVKLENQPPANYLSYLSCLIITYVHSSPCVSPIQVIGEHRAPSNIGGIDLIHQHCYSIAAFRGYPKVKVEEKLPTHEHDFMSCILCPPITSGGYSLCVIFQPPFPFLPSCVLPFYILHA